MHERFIDRAFLRKLKPCWQEERNKVLSAEEQREELKNLGKGFTDLLEVVSQPEEKHQSLMDKIRFFIIKILLPSGHLILPKEETLRAAYTFARREQIQLHRRLTQELGDAWGEVMKSRIEEASPIDRDRGVGTWRAQNTMLLALPVEDTELNEETRS